MRRPGRSWPTLGVLCVFTLATSACGAGQPTAPTPDPFNGYAARADQAFSDGMRLYTLEQYPAALDAFNQARVLSPTHDARTDEMIATVSKALTPAPTPAPPPAEAAAPAGVDQPSTVAPEAGLGAAYFGSVLLTVVPGPNWVPVPMSSFFEQDQLGLFIETLNQRLHLPFTLRIFDLSGPRLAAAVRSEAGATDAGAPGTPLARFGDQMVWYHEGGEPPGHYRAELYAGDVLTHVFDYVVGTVPVPLPTREATPHPAATEIAVATPIPSTPSLQPTPPPEAPPEAVPATPVPAPPAVQSLALQPVAVLRPAPAPLPPPAATPTPVPLPIRSVRMASPPIAFATDRTSTRTYVLDGTGLVWILEDGEPSLNAPASSAPEPSGLAVDERSDRMYVATGSGPMVVVLQNPAGQRVGIVTLSSPPGEVQLDPERRLLYVLLPQENALAIVNIDTLSIDHVVPLPTQVTGMALDPGSHTVYLSHSNGELSVLDAQTATITERTRLSDAGLAGLAVVQGQVYAIDPASRELVGFDPGTHVVSRVSLADEPVAVAAGPNTGAVFLLTAQPASIVRIDPASGTELGRLLLPDAVANTLLVNPVDETVYVASSSGQTLAVIRPESIPSS